MFICCNKDKLVEIWYGCWIGFEKVKFEYLFDVMCLFSELDE